MDHKQTLDLVVVDAGLDKVEVALGLVDRAGQELNDALLVRDHGTSRKMIIEIRA